MRSHKDIIATLLWCCLAAAAIGVALWWSVKRFSSAHSWVLWSLFALLPLVALFVLRTLRRGPMVRLSTLSTITHGPWDLLSLFRALPFAAALAGLGVLIVAMARPQSEDNWQEEQREGIDIVVALDVSTSMLAKDLRPDRLEASKRVAMEFIDGRPNDRIGLVVYEGEAFTQCPITTDHRVLKELFGGVQSGLIDGGTAVGTGLATALNRLRESEAKSKVVILLTDGVSNAGTVQPIDAAQIAEQLGIRVYTIGVGTQGKALSPVTRFPTGQYRYDYVEVEIDEKTLRSIADGTGGKYFRATDERKLKEIYDEIDRLEKTRINVTEHRQKKEEYFPFALWGTGLLLFGLLLDKTLLRTLG